MVKKETRRPTKSRALQEIEQGSTESHVTRNATLADRERVEHLFHLYEQLTATPRRRGRAAPRQR